MGISKQNISNPYVAFPVHLAIPGDRSFSLVKLRVSGRHQPAGNNSFVERPCLMDEQCVSHRPHVGPLDEVGNRESLWVPWFTKKQSGNVNKVFAATSASDLQTSVFPKGWVLCTMFWPSKCHACYPEINPRTRWRRGLRIVSLSLLELCKMHMPVLRQPYRSRTWPIGWYSPHSWCQQDKSVGTDDQATHHKSEKKFFKVQWVESPWHSQGWQIVIDFTRIFVYNLYMSYGHNQLIWI